MPPPRKTSWPARRHHNQHPASSCARRAHHPHYRNTPASHCRYNQRARNSAACSAAANARQCTAHPGQLPYPRHGIYRPARTPPACIHRTQRFAGGHVPARANHGVRYQLHWQSCGRHHKSRHRRGRPGTPRSGLAHRTDRYRLGARNNTGPPPWPESFALVVTPHHKSKSLAQHLLDKGIGGTNRPARTAWRHLSGRGPELCGPLIQKITVYTKHLLKEYKHYDRIDF